MSDVSIDLAAQLAQHDWSIFGAQGYALGLDLGSYGLRAVLAPLQGGRTHQAMADVGPEPQAAAMLAEACQLVHGLLAEAGVPAGHLLRIGVGFGGPVDARAGRTLRSHRMHGWDQLPVRDRIQETFDVVTLLDNDANVIALGEATFGAGRGRGDLFYLHLSRGVGGGIVLDGRLHQGARTLAGEIGHAPMAADGPPCRCGGRGHLESYLSIDALLRRAGELGLHTDDLHDVFSDGPAGRQTVAEAVQTLGLELARVVQLLDPSLIVLGGVVVRKAGPEFVGAVEEAVNGLLRPAFDRHVPVVSSSLGHDAVAMGGLALALQSLA